MNIEKNKSTIEDNIDTDIQNIKDKKNTFEKQQKNKEKILNKIETTEHLSELKLLVKQWIITQKVADKIEIWKLVEKKEIENMFNKIEEIEDIKNIDKYLPKEFRITKKEYIQALENKVYRRKTISLKEWSILFYDVDLFMR